MSLFCRHNRFLADCPICSKGTVLEGGRAQARRSPGGSAQRGKAPRPAKGPRPASAAFSGRYVSAGPYDDEDGAAYEVRLERVPGGIRLAEWGGSGLRKRAPVLAPADLPSLVEGARGVLEERDAARLAGALGVAAGGDRTTDPARPAGDPEAATPGVSRGRSGDFKEELRVEPVADGRLRIARWVLRPGRGWQMQEAPPMLPVARYAEAIADAARHGLVPAASDAGDPARL